MRARIPCFSRTPSAELDELLQAPETRRQLLAFGAHPPAPIGKRHLADIDVAARIDREPVRRDELARVEPGMRVAEPRQQLALARIDADPRAAIRQLDVDRHVGPDLANEEARRLGAALHIEAGGAV